MERLDRCERIRLLELATEAGCGPQELVRFAQEMESYVLGRPLSSAEISENWPEHAGETGH